MTKPTGRPRGRPKTKEYVTLMARVDTALADHVKRYASMHRQPISVVIRDALTLLMEEYPFGADPRGPQRIAAHEFLSDRYESPLDTLLGESDSAEVEALLSDTNEKVGYDILYDANGGGYFTSDTKEGKADIASDNKTGSPAKPTKTPRGSSRKVSDRKAAQAVTPSANTADAPPIMSDKKEAIAAVPSRQGGRPRSEIGQRILALLAEHPEGLSAEELRVYLKPQKPLGDTLQGMVRQHHLAKQGSGNAVRYLAVGAEGTATREHSQPKRRATRRG